MAADESQMSVEEALMIFELEQPVTPERIEERYHNLRNTWHPPRYANMTNNPKKYTKMYHQAEGMLQDIERAYKTLIRSYVSEKN